MKSRNFPFDRLLFNCMFGMVLPILCFIIGWWGSLIFTHTEKIIMLAAFSGLGFGILTSITMRLIWRFDIYQLSVPILIMIYLFYNIGMFGFFMGVPVFHPVFGVIAGYYWAKRLIVQNRSINYSTDMNQISGFTTLVLGLVCLCSAIFALSSKSTPLDLKMMFHLPFDISLQVLIIFIIGGGLLLIITQYWLTKITIIKTLEINHKI
jgi:hypothetical protein